MLRCCYLLFFLIIIFFVCHYLDWEILEGLRFSFGGEKEQFGFENAKLAISKWGGPVSSQIYKLEIQKGLHGRYNFWRHCTQIDKSQSYRTQREKKVCRWCPFVVLDYELKVITLNIGDRKLGLDRVAVPMRKYK